MRRPAVRPAVRLPPLIVGIYTITFICGMLDAACFLGLGNVFAEIMTGNLVYLAFAVGTLGTGQQLTVLPYVVVLSTFAVGALVGGRLVALTGPLGRHRVGFAVEWVALLAATMVTALTHAGAHGEPRFWVTGILAFGMGIQNAMVRRWGIPDLATNVMTLTMTGLIADSPLVGGPNTRAARRAASIAIFFGSATLGAFLVRYGVIWPEVIAISVFTLALPVLHHAEKEGGGEGPPAGGPGHA
ncbi:MAG TPA: YoaK family protein [Acidimicrobiales bacterium]|jgi:uncharacterized membrane protein YoaK (UPF0700 family)|nr:YoaK family protein [Acidimicrobiales bacterium]